MYVSHQLKELKQQTGYGGDPRVGALEGGEGGEGRGGIGSTDVLQATWTCLLIRLTTLDEFFILINLV